MHPTISVCCFSLLLLNFIGAKPISDIQSLTQLLEDEISNMPISSEEADVGESDFVSDKSMLRAPEQQDQQPWSSSDLRKSALLAKDNQLAHFLKDLLKTSKRSWGRYKKAGLRSCFGVRLERIGSFSGLGC
ncbi:PREDICTED: C-type natriuretic peptide 3-like [Cyprinodon variegatus]|uniref:Natriuretic peptide A-like n=1 Tax=Cyprinodon variegatus TaxID=28743 RepID=A0A3Q2EIR4_CYPVA|nr:PREDICTED: C-type natriuretic peptide 3-like [Cyprinodon variegatus]